jgi:hypothetical protein
MTNWQLIITLATLVFAIFGANWLNLQLMNKRIDDLKNYLDARFQAVDAEIKASRAELKGEIGTLRAEMSAMGQKVERIDRQIEALYKSALPGRAD